MQGESYSGLEAKVLETIAVKKCPRLASLLSLLDMPFQSLLRHWLPTLFTQCLPAETAVRVWDVLLLEESPACFRIGVALIKVRIPTPPFCSSLDPSLFMDALAHWALGLFIART